MSLDWNISKVDNFRDLSVTLGDGTRELKSTTSKLVWSMLSIDMREIKKENVQEVYIRLKMVELVDGDVFTMADVERHIGLYTNVRLISSAAFNRKYVERMRIDITRYASNKVSESV